MSLSWPLFGRSAELHAIESALTGPETAGIVVVGPEGVGKSRLVGAALAETQTRGVITRQATGTSAARAIPLGAFTTWAPPDSADTVSLLRGVIDALTAGSAGQTVVCVDDAHLLDDLSAFVLQQIVARKAAKLILTVLDGAVIPDPVREIWKDVRFARLDLRPMPAADTVQLLTTALGGSVDPDAARRLWKLTDGNPLYLRHIVEQEIADGRLLRQGDIWRWTGEPAMAPGLIELIEARMGGLAEPVRDVLDTLAVAEPLELDMLSKLTDPAAIELADDAGLLALQSSADGVQVRVAHPLYSEVRRRRAPATRLRRLRGLAAVALADAGTDIRTVVRRAALSMESDLPADPELLVRAAHGAVWLADLALAERLAGAASRAGAGPEADFVRAHALSWYGHGAEADRVLDRVDPDGLSDEETARLAFLRASNTLWALADPDGAKHIIDSAVVTTEDGHRYLNAFRSVYWFAVDQPQQAAEAAAGLDPEALPPVVGAEVSWVLTQLAADTGRTSEADHRAEVGHAVASRSLDAPHMRFNIADAHVSALLLAGRIGDAHDLAGRVAQQAADHPGAAPALATGVAGRVALAAGRISTATALLNQSAVPLSVTHPVGWGYRYQLSRATALAIGGQTDEAAAVLAHLDQLGRRFRTLDHEMKLARAWIAGGQGALQEAAAIARSAAETACTRGQFAIEAFCLQVAAQFGDRTCADRLGELVTMVEGPRAHIAARFAEALRDGDGAELDRVSVEFEQMGDAVAAVDAAAAAALAYRRNNLRGSALSAATRADALAEKSGGINTPALRQAAEPLPLTDREREIVMLLGAGLSNRAIAERLTLSVRTVESHIYQSMQKTETTSREELAALIQPR